MAVTQVALDDGEIYLTREEALNLIGRSAATFRKYEKEGLIKCYKWFGRKMYRKSDLLQTQPEVDDNG